MNQSLFFIHRKIFKLAKKLLNLTTLSRFTTTISAILQKNQASVSSVSQITIDSPFFVLKYQHKNGGKNHGYLLAFQRSSC